MRWALFDVLFLVEYIFTRNRPKKSIQKTNEQTNVRTDVMNTKDCEEMEQKTFLLTSNTLLFGAHFRQAKQETHKIQISWLLSSFAWWKDPQQEYSQLDVPKLEPR